MLHYEVGKKVANKRHHSDSTARAVAPAPLSHKLKKGADAPKMISRARLLLQRDPLDEEIERLRDIHRIKSNC